MLPIENLAQPHVQTLEVRRRKYHAIIVYREFAKVRHLIPQQRIRDQYLRLRPHTLTIVRIECRISILEPKPCIRLAQKLPDELLIAQKLRRDQFFPGRAELLINLNRRVRVVVFYELFYCLLLAC